MFLDKCNVNINAITYYGIISVITKHYSTDDLEMKPPLITNMMQRKDYGVAYLIENCGCACKIIGYLYCNH